MQRWIHRKVLSRKIGQRAKPFSNIRYGQDKSRSEAAACLRSRQRTEDFAGKLAKLGYELKIRAPDESVRDWEERAKIWEGQAKFAQLKHEELIQERDIAPSVKPSVQFTGQLQVDPNESELAVNELDFQEKAQAPEIKELDKLKMPEQSSALREETQRSEQLRDQDAFELPTPTQDDRSPTTEVSPEDERKSLSDSIDQDVEKLLQQTQETKAKALIPGCERCYSVGHRARQMADSATSSLASTITAVTLAGGYMKNYLDDNFPVIPKSKRPVDEIIKDYLEYNSTRRGQRIQTFEAIMPLYSDDKLIGPANV